MPFIEHFAVMTKSEVLPSWNPPKPSGWTKVL